MSSCADTEAASALTLNVVHDPLQTFGLAKARSTFTSSSRINSGCTTHSCLPLRKATSAGELVCIRVDGLLLPLAVAGLLTRLLNRFWLSGRSDDENSETAGNLRTATGWRDGREIVGRG